MEDDYLSFYLIRLGFWIAKTKHLLQLLKIKNNFHFKRVREQYHCKYANDFIPKTSMHTNATVPPAKILI